MERKGMETWWDYVMRVGEGRPQKDIAEQASIDQSGMSRWKSGKNTPSAEKVIAFARAFGRSPVEALVAAGYLEADDAGGTVEIVRGAESFTDSELTEEIKSRMVKRDRSRRALEVIQSYLDESLFEDIDLEYAPDIEPLVRPIIDRLRALAPRR